MAQPQRAPSRPSTISSGLRYPGESAEYRAARDKLLEEEIELRRHLERVAAQRRALPEGGKIKEDYRFDGADGPVTLSALFAPGKSSLVIYNYMFGPERDEPCPMCTAFLDAFDGAALHLSQRINLAIIARSPITRILNFARQRGWRNLRLLSSANNSYSRDYFAAQEPHGKIDQSAPNAKVQDVPMIDVFRKDGSTIRHCWSSEMCVVPPDPGQDPRHGDLINPIFNTFDLTPGGRGDFYTKLRYDERH